MEANREAKAILKYARISPRKVKIVLDLIRGKDADKAMAILMNTRKSASEYLIKLLKSAIANAENNKGLSSENLYVAECYSTSGSLMKRISFRARGRADRLLKKTCHITFILDELKEAK